MSNKIYTPEQVRSAIFLKDDYEKFCERVHHSLEKISKSDYQELVSLASRLEALMPVFEPELRHLASLSASLVDKVVEDELQELPF